MRTDRRPGTMTRFPVLAAWLAVLIASSAATASGQITSSVVSGFVTDATGQSIAGASIRLEDPLHRVSRLGVTDVSGLYRFVDVSPSTYSLVAEANGFEPAVRDRVRVVVGARVRVDVTLTVAGFTETVDVSADTARLQSQSGEVGTVLEAREVEQLPLNRRDFLQLAMLGAGVLPPVEDSELSTRGAFAMHASGAREEFNNFTLDGVDNNDPYVNRYVVQPPMDSIQEFEVAINAYSAEYGRSAGGQVNVITRRGSGQLDGYAYEYHRNEALNARHFFDDEGERTFLRNQFGGGLGGPVPGTRLFFFGALDVLREDDGQSRLATVPTEAERRGDLSAFARPIVDPFTGQPFAGNRIPASRISPLAQQVLALFPLPNRSGASGNHLGQPVQRDRSVQGSVRVDHARGPSQVGARYSQGHTDLFEPFSEDTGAAPGFGNFVDDRATNLMLNDGQVLGTRVVNDLRFGYNRFARDILPENHLIDVGTAWGVSWLDVPERAWGYPAFNMAGSSRVGDTTSLPIVRSTRTYHVADSVTVSLGRHLLKSGAEVRVASLQSRLDLLARGSLSFSGALSGAGIGDLLLGLPSFTLRAVADNPMDLESTACGAYVQDEWQVSRALTLSLGLRYEYVTPSTDPGDRMSTLDMTTGQVVRVGTNGVPRAGIEADVNNLAPRVGIAWRPSPSTVIRGGYGVFFDSGMFSVHSSLYFNPPQFTLQAYFPSAGGLPTLDNPFPSSSGFVPPPTLNVLSPDFVNARLQHWNVSVERAAGPIGLVTVAYVGSAGAQLVRPRDINQPAPGPGPVQPRRPNPQYGSIFFIESAGHSSYHSMQVSVNRPLRRGVTFRAAYTFGKSIDENSAFLEVKTDQNFPQNSRAPELERGVSSFDVRHRLAMAYMIGLPTRWSWTRGTSVRGIVTIQGGQPLTPVLRFDNSNTGNTGGTFGSDRPNLVGTPALANPGPEAWFNTAAFAIPAQYTFGNAGRNVVRGPGYASWDLSVARRVALGSRVALVVEAQAFNLFNRTNFEQPELYADEPVTFGRVFAARAPRQIQLAARLQF